jgi:hypothetical protein
LYGVGKSKKDAIPEERMPSLEEGCHPLKKDAIP